MIEKTTDTKTKISTEIRVVRVVLVTFTSVFILSIAFVFVVYLGNS